MVIKMLAVRIFQNYEIGLGKVTRLIQLHLSCGKLTIILFITAAAVMPENYEAEQDTNFKHNEMIWGKVTGHPWWPGILTVDPNILDQKLYRVDFFGDNPTHSILPASKIIRYESFEKSLNNGRPSPELKRAITEASILYSTLEESRYSCDHNENLAKTSLIDSDPIVSPMVTGFLQHEFTTPRKFTFKRIIQHKSASSVQTSGNIYSRKLKHKKRVNKDRKQKVRKLLRESKNLLREKKEMAKRLLKKYRLDDIPKPGYGHSAKTIDVDKLVIRKVYRILRRRYEPETSRDQALLVKGKIGCAFDLHEFIRSLPVQTDPLYTDI